MGVGIGLLVGRAVAQLVPGQGLACIAGLATYFPRSWRLPSGNRSRGGSRGLRRLPGGKGGCRLLVGGAMSWRSGRLAMSRGVSRERVTRGLRAL